MAYSQLSDYLLEFAESGLAIYLGDPTGTTIDEDKLTNLIEHADNQIDSYLAQRYKTPVDDYIPTSNTILRDLSMDLAVYQIFENYYQLADLPDAVKDRARFSIYLLQKISDGRYEPDFHQEMVDGGWTKNLNKLTSMTGIELQGRNLTETDLENYYDGI